MRDSAASAYLAEADQREMAERRHRPALDEVGRRRAPAQRSKRSQGNLDRQPSRCAIGWNMCSSALREPPVGADAVDDHQLSARPQHAQELVERDLGMGHRVDDVLGDDDIEGAVRRIRGPRRPSPRAARRAASPSSATRCACHLQHRLGNIDAHDAAPRRVVGQRDARADAHLQDASADLLAGSHGGSARILEDGPEDHVVDRRPAARRF